MLLTITTTRAPATDLGYLLHKHPDRPQSFADVLATLDDTPLRRDNVRRLVEHLIQGN